MNQPKGLTVDDRGNIYIADTMNMAIRKISDTGKCYSLYVSRFCPIIAIIFYLFLIIVREILKNYYKVKNNIGIVLENLCLS